PTEVKNNENRVAITPDGVRELVRAGVTVLIEAGAGEASSITHDEMSRAGAPGVPDAPPIWGGADLVCHGKEPPKEEAAQTRAGGVLFPSLHLAAYPRVAEALIDQGVTAIAYETVQAPDGTLPLLAPMSEVAGRMATQVGAHYLEREHGGKGVLLGGAPG